MDTKCGFGAFVVDAVVVALAVGANGIATAELSGVGSGFASAWALCAVDGCGGRVKTGGKAVARSQACDNDIASVSM